MEDRHRIDKTGSLRGGGISVLLFCPWSAKCWSLVEVHMLVGFVCRKSD